MRQPLRVRRCRRPGPRPLRPVVDRGWVTEETATVPELPVVLAGRVNADRDGGRWARA